MNRKVLLQVTLPALIIGAILIGVCFFGAWSIDRVQTSFAQVLSENVTSLEAAQDLEIRVRQLRHRSFLNVIDPQPEREATIADAHRHFEEALQVARDTSFTPQEQNLVTAIEAGYKRYHAELDQIREEFAKDDSRANLAKLSDSHPIRHVVEPCQEFLRLNKEEIVSMAEESNRITGRAHLAMIVLGAFGPVGGLLIGFGIARGLSRSIAQLSVRVQDMARHLDEHVGSVCLTTEGDLHGLDKQMQEVVHRVEEAATRLQRHQKEMLRAEQLSAVGQLAASVAHEVRNPLTAIKMLVEAALRPMNVKPLTAQDLKVIHKEIVRLEARVQGLLDYARLPTPRRLSFDLRELINEAVDLIRARAQLQNVEVSVSNARHAVMGSFDREQMRTVIVNLLMNALDAMPHGGQLSIDVTTKDDERIQLRVTDTGSGIPTEMESRLFTPFASSKPTGTGLGLSMSRRIIEEHGGSIVAENRMKTEGTAGACFVIRLPGVAAVAEC